MQKTHVCRSLLSRNNNKSCDCFLEKYVSPLYYVTELLAVPLLVSWTSGVKLVDETNTSNITSLTPDTSGVIAVDYHYARREIYYSDGKGRISR